jgi:hypothetical protein
MKQMKVLTILLSAYSVFSCKPVCNINQLVNDAETILSELDKQVSIEIQILDLELKMVLIAETINFQKRIDKIFKELSDKHLEQHNKYESMLANIGLSPAREDEIYKIEEMEKRNGIIQSIYE